jgi:hypothetical protein
MLDAIRTVEGAVSNLSLGKAGAIERQVHGRLDPRRLGRSTVARAFGHERAVHGNYM